MDSVFYWGQVSVRPYSVVVQVGDSSVMPTSKDHKVSLGFSLVDVEIKSKTS